MAGAFVFGSLSPMTVRISPDGQPNQVSARWQACSRMPLSTVFRTSGAVASGGPHRHRRACHRAGRPCRRSGRRAAQCLSSFAATNSTGVSAAGPASGPVAAHRCPDLPDRARTSGFRRTILGPAPSLVYRISTAAYGVEPHQARYITGWPRTLDVDAMTAASRNLLGLTRLRSVLSSPRSGDDNSRPAAVRLGP